MYQINRNNYHLKPKNSTIYTPKEVSEFIFELLKDKINKEGIILDPCCGRGSLLKPWEDNGHPFAYKIYGIDIDEETESNLIADFLTLTKKGFKLNYFAEFKKPQDKLALILCNPPFNGYYPKLGSEVWLDKIIELFGKDVPIVLFAPVGFLMNLTLKSKRHEKFENGIYPPIVSRITLPKNIFPDVIFHSEILIFNITGLEPHYFYQEKKHE